MARPIKNGLDYFPLDCQMDDKFDFIEAKHGIVGWAVLIKVFQKIYFQGYHLEWTDKAAILFASKNKVDIDTLNEIIDDAIEDKIFDEKIYQKFNVLTSHGIQRRYVEATKRRKEIKCIKQIALTDFNVHDNSVNVNINSQSKVKESKVKESKEKYGELKNVLLTESEYKKLQGKFSSTLDDKIESLSLYIKSKGKKYASHYATILSWARKDGPSGEELEYL
jgi:hypothetical protein